MLPGSLLRGLGLTPDRQAHFTLPGGRRELMNIGDVRLTVEGSSGVTPSSSARTAQSPCSAVSR